MGKLLQVALRKPNQPSTEWHYGTEWWRSSKRTGCPEDMLFAINGSKSSLPWYKTLAYDLINKKAKHGQTATSGGTST